MNADVPMVFGPFVFRESTGALHRHGSRVELGRRALALLNMLLRAEGRPVSKSDLMDAAWPDTSIEESNLTVQIAALRKALGRAPDGGDWIVTVPGVGYRFAPSSPAVIARNDIRSLDLPPEVAGSKPSIAVLAFTNMSSDPEQEYFADGLSEDLITDLSKVPGLVVIARNSSFAYKGKALDVRQIARELGVRYVVEGSVRRAAERVRITSQLIDTTANAHVWADRFDRDLADVFALQDEVVAKIIAALAPVLPSGQPVFGQRAKNLEAYDLFVRARVLSMLSAQGNMAALPLLERAISIEPDFADAHAWLAMAHHFSWLYWREPEEPHRTRSRSTSAKAVSLSPGNADARWINGYVKTYDGDLPAGEQEFAAALRINPNHADAWALFTDLKVLLGLPGEAVACARNAFRLNPYPPAVYYWVMGWALYAARRYEEAIETLRHDLSRASGAHRLLAANLAQIGRLEEARAEAQLFLSSVPHFSVVAWARTQPFVNDADRQHFVNGYLKAGLPE